jgi:hypothetical protein
MAKRSPVIPACIAACLLISLLFTSACVTLAADLPAPAEDGAAANPAQTVTPRPTATPTPTATPEPEPTPFSVAWMTDTQEYVANNKDVFCSMTQWIADTTKERNTLLTIHTGDIIRSIDYQYQIDNMNEAFSYIPDDMMIVTVAGNHDHVAYGNEFTPYLWNRPDTNVEEENTLYDGFVYYMTFEAGNVRYLVVSISYGFELLARDWVNQVCEQYSDHYAILCLHSYLTKSDYSTVGVRYIKDVVEPSPNIRLVLCGHIHGVAYLPEEIDDDGDGIPERTVNQMLFNMQGDSDDGLGFMRMLEFDTQADTIGVYTYSPYLDVEGYDGKSNDGFGANHTIENAGLSEFRMQPEG